MTYRLKPTYNLKKLKEAFNDVYKLLMTSSAKQGQVSLGFSDYDVVNAIQNLKTTDFIKSMKPVNKKFTAWQDVYKSRFNGIELYIKFQINFKKEIILSFKEK